MIAYNGYCYVLNLDKVFEMTSKMSNGEKKEQEITDGFELVREKDEALTLTSRVVHEVKTPGDGQGNTIKYDFIRILVEQLLSVENWDNRTFGDEIVMNTLITNGILEEVPETDCDK